MTRVPIVAAAALAFAGCAASPGASPLAQVPTRTISSLVPPSRPMIPDACNKGMTELFRASGGSFPMPTCGSWQGVINYPPPSAPFHATVRVSTTKNYGVPPPPSGTAIFYMEMVSKSRHTMPVFDGPTNVQDMITSQTFDPSHSYTLIVYNLAYNDQCGSNPSCPPWVEDLGSPAPSSHSLTFASPFYDTDWSVYPMVWQFVQN